MAVQSPSAPRVQVDAPQTRTTHRLRCVYTLLGVEVKQHGDPVGHKLDMDRFELHYREAGQSLPGVVHMKTLKAAKFAFVNEDPGVEIKSVTAYVFSVPNSEPIGALEIDFTGDVLAVIPLLRETCFQRDELRVMTDGKRARASLVYTMTAGASAERLEVERGARLGRDVHQLFMPAGATCTELLTTDEHGICVPDVDRVARIVYRADGTHRTEYAALKVPKELNRPSSAVAGHARGVTVLGGNAAHVEDAAFIVAVQLLSASATLRRISRDAREALEVLDTTVQQHGDLAARHAVLSSLGTELSRLQVQLSFGVEANAMPLHVPEVVLEHYQESLAESLGLDTACEVVSKMLERLSLAMTATAGSLLAIEQERDNSRRERWIIAIGLLSTIAIPLAIIFGFFGMSGNDIKSDLSFINSHYWPFYICLTVLIASSFCLFYWLKSKGNQDRKHLEALSDQPPRDVMAQLPRSTE